MKIYTPKDWMDKKLDTSSIQEEVKSNAADIRTRRLGKSQELLTNAVRIQQEKDSICSFFSQIKQILSRLKVDATNRTALLQLFDDIESEYDKYELKTRSLATRFKNNKIRILAFGSKSQGKSSFIQTFTKLGDDIVQTKKTGNRDKTGTTCIYYHKEGISKEDPEIKVIFRKPDEIKDIINKSLQSLSIAGLKIDDKTSFKTWEELAKVLNDRTKKEKAFTDIEKCKQDGDISVPGFGAHKATLQSFFDPDSDYSDINSSVDSKYFDKDGGKSIEKADLPKYNDMQYSGGGKKYQVVSEIHISLDLECSNMFKDIEICDTKGMSVEAGGSSWEEELYKEIGNCDAAFSIQMDGNQAVGQSSEKFYEDLNSVRSNHSYDLKDLRLKHYIIWNAFDNCDPSEVEKNAKKLIDRDLAHNLYIGALKDKAKYGDTSLGIKEFVNFVIYDMIKSIVVNTNETDKNLLKDLASCKNKIENLQKLLSKLLVDIEKELPEKTLDWDDVLKKAILKQREQLITEIILWAKTNNVSLPPRNNSNNQSMKSSHPQTSSEHWSDDDDDDIVGSNNISDIQDYTNEDISTVEYTPNEDEISRGVYRMLTNEELGKNEKISNTDAVKKAVEKLYNKCIGKTGIKKGYLQTNIIGSSQNIGAFIDHLSALLFEEVKENINYCFIANSNNQNLIKFKNDLFKMIWDKFFLSDFCDQNDFNIEIFESMLRDDSKKSRLIKKWVDCYHSTGDNKAEGLYPRTSFAILKSYFDKIEEMPSEMSLADVTLPIYDQEKLKEAVIEAYEYHDYVTRYKQQINNDLKAKRSVLDITMSEMAIENIFVEDLFDLYKTLKPTEYSNILLKCGLISDEEKSEFENQECIKSFKVYKQQLVSFKSSL